MASRLSGNGGAAVVLALAFGLGTPALAYSNELYQHQTAAFGAFVGFFLLWRVMEEGAPERDLWAVGVLFGYAAACEYVLVPVLTGVVVWACVRMHRRRRLLLRVAAGAALWVVATAAYNLLAFGTPLPVGYRYSVFGIPPKGVFGLIPPSWESVYGITFSSARGLFFLAPFLLLAPAGLYTMIRRGGRTRELAMVILAICAVFFVYNASYWVWTGGDAIGPRFLVPMLPFLSLPIIFVFAAADRVWQRGIIAVLVGVSVALVWTEFLAGNGFPPEGVNALFEYSLPLLREGALRLNVGNVIGLRGFATLLPLVAILGFIVLVVPFAERLWLTRRLERPG
jgi:hypothetical protein